MATTDEEPAGQGEDLSVPMWVWTLLGFALVTAVVIVVIIVGGARHDDAGQDSGAETYEEEPATMPAETQPGEAGAEAATQPS